MILLNQPTPNSKLNLKQLPVFLVLFALLGGLFYSYKTNKIAFLSKKKAVSEAIYCDAETLDGDFYRNGTHQFENPKQSDEKARSGKFSCKLAAKGSDEYGFGYTLRDFKAGELYKASVWRFRPEGGNALLVAAADSAQTLYTAEGLTNDTDKKGWEKIQLFFRIPSHKKINQVKIYVYSDGKKVIYFDDLSIEKINEKEALVNLNNEDNQTFTPELVKIEIDPKGYQKLEAKRGEALRKGLLDTDENDWVKGKFSAPSIGDKDQTIPIQLRLKGDWLDHLNNNKWSFRMKAKDPGTWRRLVTWSVQTPAVREQLMEWFLHQLWEREGVLTTRYDFIELELNGKSLGVYNYEEHFEKQIVEYHNRREGPVVKFDETGFWAGIGRQLNALDGVDYSIHQTEKLTQIADIEPFNAKETEKTKVLYKEFEQAKILMYQYQQGTKKASEIFDIDRLARYYALCDALSAYHSVAWHNERFYYNPVTSLLEPIGYDGFPTEGGHITFLGQAAHDRKFIDGTSVFAKVFDDPAFMEKYNRYVYKYTSRAYLQQVIAELDEGLRERESYLRQEFKEYHFDRQGIIDKAQRVNLLILPYNQLSLQCFRSPTLTLPKEEGRSELSVGNVHGLPLQIIGAGQKMKQIDQVFTIPFFIPAYAMNAPIQYQTIPIKGDYSYLFYKVVGIDSVFSSKIQPWQAADGARISTRQSLFSDIKLENNAMYSIDNQRNIIYFKSGDFKTEKDVLIPSGYRVALPEGFKLDLIKKAKFISLSPIDAYGTEEHPILITSSDKSSQGFHVIKAPPRPSPKGREIAVGSLRSSSSPLEGLEEASFLHYVIFDNLNTLNDRNWMLTGAVTFYEANVNIRKCVFRNNHCEDAINIVRSEFLFDESLVADTYGDGLDLDFCTGVISNSQFLRTGNDGADCSGSHITIKNCDMENNGDKGVSIGEFCHALVENIRVKNANIGIAAKDLSELTITNIALDHCNQGFAAYQKKPEFGGGKIYVQDYIATQVKILYNIAASSYLELKGKVVKM